MPKPALPMDRPVVLLHGWPYDIYSYVDMAPLLARAGYRVIVPYLRGFGTTHFLSSATLRNGQPSVVALDTIALMDALKIEKAFIGGFDWGARSADIIAALWPERCKALVSVSGYLIGSPESGKIPLPPAAEFQWWYQFLFCHGTRSGWLRQNTGTILRRRSGSFLASPKWHFDDATFDRTAAAFENPDHVAIVIHNYRWRLLRLAAGDPKYDDLEKAARRRAPVVERANDHSRGRCRMARLIWSPASTPRNSAGKYSHRLIVQGGVGHNLPQEAPAGFCPGDRRRCEGLIGADRR